MFGPEAWVMGSTVDMERNTGQRTGHAMDEDVNRAYGFGYGLWARVLDMDPDADRETDAGSLRI